MEGVIPTLSKSISFTVPGQAVGKQRPRFSRISGRTYTPEKTVNYETLVRLSYQQQVDAEPFERDKPLALKLEIYQQIPNSVSKKKREMMIRKKILPTKKPDCSNILKAIEDGLNQVAFHDDSQIVKIYAVKYFSEYPEVKVTISEI